jgi:ceramide glucosyltransferase
MGIHLIGVLEVLSAAGACSGTGYYLACLWSAKKFVRERRARSGRGAEDSVPPVSILKPVRGIDPEMYESFRSHCVQDYPDYEIIFGVQESDDPALPLMERLKAEFPQRDIRVQVLPEVLGPNIKVSNLAQMAPRARYEYLVVNDSDIRVGPDYLRRVMAEFNDESVGLVTCLYRGTAGKTLGSKLEALGISTDFCAGVLLAQELEGGVRFGLGSTLALRKRELEAIGGFEALVDYLADDYWLGARIAGKGKRVVVADPIVETFLPPYSWRGFVHHQLRWARGIRDSRPWGYLGLVMTYGVPWALLAVFFARGSGWAWALLGIAVVARLWMARVVGHEVLKDRQVGELSWLVPVRDCVGLFLWAAAYAGHTVHWRGREFVLRDGKLECR